MAAKYGDVESVDELLEIMRYPCTVPHHPDNHELTASVCELVASKIRSVKDSAATDDIADMMTAASTNLDETLAKQWREYSNSDINGSDPRVAVRMALRGTLKKDTVVTGDLNLKGAHIAKLPENLTVQGSLILDDSTIKELPAGLVVYKDIRLSNSKIEYLPANLHVSESLNIRATPIKQLPTALYVGWNLNLEDTKIDYMPPDAEIGNWVFMPDGKPVRGESEARAAFEKMHKSAKPTTKPAISELESAQLFITEIYPDTKIDSIKVGEIYYEDRGWVKAPFELNTLARYLIAKPSDQGKSVQLLFDRSLGFYGGEEVMQSVMPDFQTKELLKYVRPETPLNSPS